LGDFDLEWAVSPPFGISWDIMGIYGTSIKIPEKSVENPCILDTCHSQGWVKSRVSLTLLADGEREVIPNSWTIAKLRVIEKLFKYKYLHLDNLI
jgi:hypothetical protein